MGIVEYVRPLDNISEFLLILLNNSGVYLCIRCSGIHRGMGTHISKVKSIDLDTWTPEQMQVSRTQPCVFECSRFTFKLCQVHREMGK